MKDILKLIWQANMNGKWYTCVYWALFAGYEVFVCPLTNAAHYFAMVTFVGFLMVNLYSWDYQRHHNTGDEE